MFTQTCHRYKTYLQGIGRLILYKHNYLYPILCLLNIWVSFDLNNEITQHQNELCIRHQ